MAGTAGGAVSQTEIEVKFLIPLDVMKAEVRARGLEAVAIEQIYLSASVVEAFAGAVGFAWDERYTEWRIRQKGGKYIFTAKGKPNDSGTSRLEFEVGIDPAVYAQLKQAAGREGALKQILKDRYTQQLALAAGDAEMVFDVFHEVCGRRPGLDFAVCEVEVTSHVSADALMAGRFEAGLQFLAGGLNVTGLRAFTNAYVCEQGFIETTFSAVRSRLN